MHLFSLTRRLKWVKLLIPKPLVIQTWVIWCTDFTDKTHCGEKKTYPPWTVSMSANKLQASCSSPTFTAVIKTTTGGLNIYQLQKCHPPYLVYQCDLQMILAASTSQEGQLLSLKVSWGCFAWIQQHECFRGHSVKTVSLPGLTPRQNQIPKVPFGFVGGGAKSSSSSMCLWAANNGSCPTNKEGGRTWRYVMQWGIKPCGHFECDIWLSRHNLPPRAFLIIICFYWKLKHIYVRDSVQVISELLLWKTSGKWMRLHIRQHITWLIYLICTPLAIIIISSIILYICLGLVHRDFAIQTVVFLRST